jgi:hypothetical protein
VALPLGCYYAVTLALPLANGAGQAGEVFVDHAIVVVLVPLLLIGLVGTLCWVVRTLGRAVPLRRPAAAAYVGGAGCGAGTVKGNS